MMEAWQVNTLNKCAKDGNLPKGFPFNKEQLISILGLNPAEFILLQKEGFISRIAPGSDNFVTSDRWDTLKQAGNYDALVTIENKDKPVIAPPPSPVVEPKKAAAPQTAKVEEKPAPAVAHIKKEEPAPAQNTAATKDTTPNKPAAPPAFAKEPAKPTPAPYAPVAQPEKGMDMVSMICLAAAVIGIIIVVYSMVKK
jgi:hypothetical protein